LLVLGKAKVISYKDLKEAQAKRAKKETAKEAKEAKGKGKHSWKYKSATLEADEATADKAKHSWKRKRAVLEADTPKPVRALGVQISETQVVEDKSTLELFRALVAQI
jgi:hypothetical protein